MASKATMVTGCGQCGQLRVAVGVAGWLPGYAEWIDSGSRPADVAALEIDARVMAHLIEEDDAVGAMPNCRS
ncbi:hypothetical protein AOB60_06830 [Streptomyces noursei]|uniref:Uncharacterized protein n=1 Tax=Streptomyces noursei TaxID=1971 RepID=A0A2N8PHY5_STRNR|nr:hypothetical protein AOB60_06830 [Streptomyces noursei]